MINGHIDIDFVTYEMLEQITFEETDVSHANGYWEDLQVDRPSYPIGAPVVHQLFGIEKMPKFIQDIAAQFDFVEYNTVTINKLTPGCFIPPHKDKFYRLNKFLVDNNLQSDKYTMKRYNIFLQNYQFGHILELDGNVCTNYKQGDFTIIHQNVMHSVANLTHNNRYTMQITGVVNSEDNK